MTDEHVTVQYRLGEFTIRGRTLPDLEQVRALSLFARNRIAADLQFTLKRYTCDQGEVNSLTLAERISAGEGTSHFNESSCLRVSTRDWTGYMDLLARRIWLLTTQESVNEAYVGILRHYLRHIIPPHKGIFVHCAGVHIAGQTMLFLAPSGTGKTTLSRLAHEKGFHVLSDETVFISWNRAEFMAHATPLGRLSSGPLSSPIAKVFFLRQGEAFDVQPLSAPRALIAAWNDSHYRDFWTIIPGMAVVHVRNDHIGADQKRTIVNRWFDLFSSVPCYEMQFTRDFDDWDKLLALPAHE